MAAPSTRAGFACVVLGERVGDGSGLVEQFADGDARERGRHQPEGAEHGEASADVGVGQKDGAVAGLDGSAVQRRAGVGDDDDVLARVEPGLLKRALEDAALGVRLDGGTRLGGHHQKCAVQVAVVSADGPDRDPWSRGSQAERRRWRR